MAFKGLTGTIIFALVFWISVNLLVTWHLTDLNSNSNTASASAHGGNGAEARNSIEGKVRGGGGGQRRKTSGNIRQYQRQQQQHEVMGSSGDHVISDEGNEHGKLAVHLQSQNRKNGNSHHQQHHQGWGSQKDSRKALDENNESEEDTDPPDDDPVAEDPNPLSLDEQLRQGDSIPPLATLHELERRIKKKKGDEGDEEEDKNGSEGHDSAESDHHKQHHGQGHSSYRNGEQEDEAVAEGKHHHHQPDHKAKEHKGGSDAHHHHHHHGHKHESESEGGKAVSQPKKAHRKKGSILNIPVDDSIASGYDSPDVFFPHCRPLRFIVIGDWGGPGRKPQRDVANAMHRFSVARFNNPLAWEEPGPNEESILATIAARKSGRLLNTKDGENSLVSVSKKKTNVSGADLLAPLDFLISTGDNMYEDGVANLKDRKFHRNFEDVYTQSSLQVRWYMSLGNHDHGAHGVFRDVTAQVEYTNHSKKWYMPSTYYAQRFFVHAYSDDGDGREPLFSSVPFGTKSKKKCVVCGEGSKSGDLSQSQMNDKKSCFSVLLLVMDTYDVSPHMTRMTARQLRWVRQKLENSEEDWKIVVGHRPLFSSGKKHGSSPYMQKTFMKLLKEKKVALYFSGDDHQLQLHEKEGVTFVVSGAGARAQDQLKQNGVPEMVFQSPLHGFVYVSLTASNAQLDFVNRNGNTIFTYNVVRPDLRK